MPQKKILTLISLLRGMLGIPNFFPKSWFPNDVSQSHVIYHFGKCATISWDYDTSFGNQLLGKKFGISSISPLLNINISCHTATSKNVISSITNVECLNLWLLVLDYCVL
jgi:hypothetical protein